MDLTAKQKVQVDSVIVNRELTPLLSGKAAKKNGSYCSINYDKFKAVNAVCLLNQPYIRQFPDAFKETPSTLPGNNVHLTVAEGASTVI